MRTSFPSLVLYALVAVATFNCVLAVPVGWGIGFEIPKFTSSSDTEKIVIIGLNAMDKEQARLEVSPVTKPNVKPEMDSAPAYGSTKGKFVTDFPINCVLDLYKIEKKPKVGRVPTDRDRIRGPRKANTFFTAVWDGGVFDKMVATCYGTDVKFKWE
ncbi:hypothetical protein BDP27DRAFT_1445945 [Rhodocollybia butyracea]|uniref:Uncharacterized protein n=1 Tax=Rhodocollybia butyracea TaxID=206335 RepID=A0A9P5UAC9_9AGAR|nr:hypothetical protein BDP27DRAFT_1445945 [Rhodocollybia butyracea]